MSPCWLPMRSMSGRHKAKEAIRRSQRRLHPPSVHEQPDGGIVFFNLWCKNSVMRRHMPSTKLRQAFLVWTSILSLLLVGIGTQPRAFDSAPHATSVSFSTVQAPDHAATLTTIGKIHRTPEYRHGSDTDFAALVPAASFYSSGPDLAADLATSDQPRGVSCCRVPEARAPPQI